MGHHVHPYLIGRFSYISFLLGQLWESFFHRSIKFMGTIMVMHGVICLYSTSSRDFRPQQGSSEALDELQAKNLKKIKDWDYFRKRSPSVKCIWLCLKQYSLGRLQTMRRGAGEVKISMFLLHFRGTPLSISRKDSKIRTLIYLLSAWFFSASLVAFTMFMLVWIPRPA